MAPGGPSTHSFESFRIASLSFVFVFRFPFLHLPLFNPVEGNADGPPEMICGNRRLFVVVTRQVSSYPYLVPTRHLARVFGNRKQNINVPYGPLVRYKNKTIGVHQWRIQKKILGRGAIVATSQIVNTLGEV